MCVGSLRRRNHYRYLPSQISRRGKLKRRFGLYLGAVGFRCVVPSTAAPTTTLTSAPKPSPVDNSDSDGEDTNKSTGGTNQLQDDDDDDSAALLIGILFGVAIVVFFVLFCCTSTTDSQGRRRVCFGYCYCDPFFAIVVMATTPKRMPALLHTHVSPKAPPGYTTIFLSTVYY